MNEVYIRVNLNTGEALFARQPPTIKTKELIASRHIVVVKVRSDSVIDVELVLPSLENSSDMENNNG